MEEIYTTPTSRKLTNGLLGEGKAEDEDEEFEVFSTLEVHSETWQKDLVVAVRKGPILGTSFHPELTTDNRLHEWWVKEVVIPAWKNSKQIN